VATYPSGRLGRRRKWGALLRLLVAIDLPGNLKANLAGLPFVLPVAGGVSQKELYLTLITHLYWLDINSSLKILHLRHQIELALVRTGNPADTWRLAPHITVARLKKTPLSAVDRFETRYGTPSAAFHRTDE